MTLNVVIALILRFSPNSIDFQADYVTAVKDKPIMSVKYCLPVPIFHFWPKLERTLQRGLSAIAELLVILLIGLICLHGMYHHRYTHIFIHRKKGST